MYKQRKENEYSVSKQINNIENKRVFDFLNRVFDRMKMHKVENRVYITEKRRQIMQKR